MPKARVKKLTIAHVYDDGSEMEFEIEATTSEEGDYVTIKEGTDLISITPEIWPQMVETIGGFFEQMGAERQIANEKAQARARADRDPKRGGTSETKQEPAQ